MNLLRTIYKGLDLLHVYFKAILFTLVFKMKLRLNGVVFGKGLRTFNAVPSLQINRKSGKVLFGNNVTFNNYTDQSWNSKCKLYVLKGASLRIGDHSGMNGSMIFCANSITIGEYVNIGGGTRISDTNHHNLDWKKRRDPKTNLIAKTAPIIIEDDVFIGANCYIGKGVTIGARTIIAAGSVVVKSIPSDCIAGGNPCRVIKIVKVDK